MADNSTFTEYNGKGFYLEELFIEIVSHFICQSYENIGLNSFNLALIEVYEYCEMNRRTGSYTSLILDDIINPTDAQTLISVLEQAKPLILAYGTELTTANLNQLEATKTAASLRHVWILPIKTPSLVTTLSLIQQLLNGTFPYTNQSYHYQGFDDARPSEIII
jgi:hypothetical protein